MNKIKDIPCIILSGGKSSRMGSDKSLLPFGNYSTLIQFQYERLSKLFEDVYISSKNDKFDFLENKSKLILDNQDISSPMIALNTIFDKLESKKVFIITVDTPLIKLSTIQKLCDESNQDITLAKDNEENIHNLCAVFDKKVHVKIKKFLEDDIHKISNLVKSSNFREIKFEDGQQFININTEENYKSALMLL